MLYRLVRFAVLIVAPYWYLKMYLAGIKVRPSDYFLQQLSEQESRYKQTILLIIVLSLAAINYDAAMAISAIRSIKPPIPLWALSAKNIRLLFEAPLWLGALGEFDLVKQEVINQSSSSSRVRSILSFYDAFARDQAELTDHVRSQMILPALFLDKMAAKACSEGRLRDSADAIRDALRFVPEGDPRREELVARFLQVDAAIQNRIEL